MTQEIFRIRTPEEILGRDRLVQLIFEGYEVFPIGTFAAFQEIMDCPAGVDQRSLSPGESPENSPHAVVTIHCGYSKYKKALERSKDGPA